MGKLSQLFGFLRPKETAAYSAGREVNPAGPGVDPVKAVNVPAELPVLAKHPKSKSSSWSKVPLGVGGFGDVVWDVLKDPHLLVAGRAGMGKTELQRTVLFHCVQHKEKWSVMGIDLHGVDLPQYRKHGEVVLDVATDLAMAVEVLRFARREMVERYGEMDLNKVDSFTDLRRPPKALLVMVNEASLILTPERLATDGSSTEDALRAEASKILESIAAKGRAAGVHLVVSTQRPEESRMGVGFKSNLSATVVTGSMDSISSQIALGNQEATALAGDVKGRSYIQFRDSGEQFQGYFLDRNAL